MSKLENYKYKNLEMLRNAHKMTIDELMCRLGYNCGRSKYYNWQSGGNIKIADIVALHDIFNVSTDCILDVNPLHVGEKTAINFESDSEKS